jgi:hypothetical protein
MPFKENLKAKIKLDRLFQKLVSTIQDPPGRWWLDKALTQELLDMTDLEHKKVKDTEFKTIYRSNYSLSFRGQQQSGNKGKNS